MMDGMFIYIISLGTKVFYIEYISVSESVDLLIRDSTILKYLNQIWSPNQYKLNFRDSYLLIPSSLKDLSKFFQVDTPKDVFPQKFVSIDNLDYVGQVPSIDIFFEISKKTTPEGVIFQDFNKMI